MYRKRQERRRKVLQHLIWWHPLILLMVLSILGACARGQGAAGAPLPASQSAAEISESVAQSLVEETTAELKLIEEPKDPASIAQAMAEAEQSSEIWEEESSPGETSGQAGLPVSAEPDETSVQGSQGVLENGNYTSKEEVALYLHLYGHLPSNYITKRKAEERGWNSSRGNLGDVLPGMSIGGSGFGNYEGLLPAEKGRKYFECDIDYDGGYRNAKRIVYSNDGLIFYTEDHYKTFEQLY